MSLAQRKISHSPPLLPYRLRLPRLWKVGRQMGTQATTKTAMAAWILQGRRDPPGQAAAQTVPSLMLWRVSALYPYPLLPYLPSSWGAGWGLLGPSYRRAVT